VARAKSNVVSGGRGTILLNNWDLVVILFLVDNTCAGAPESKWTLAHREEANLLDWELYSWELVSPRNNQHVECTLESIWIRGRVEFTLDSRGRVN
jgi:hypothetical protein